ncbi:MAG: nuclear transport factor 2 family protein [Gracilimonas sp.]|uniref:nuclear transport factor 2 family protein n=1 Tax=Gracilimonas TaxID=649462 RepID=UPI001B1EE889|nr:nuclear transport factor 2 family protein [Gracilimonas sp.]MBO6585734.1 nuclear transport factor 2 family protein [Gracilimonas sp.]MBO6616731.1 nuclear transport factor 2 family protein [Gracilimonas sp.]
MHKNEKLITRFYSAFQDLDTESMMSCYHEEASFKDPVFDLGSKEEIDAMWSMLCSKAKEFDLRFHSVRANDQRGSAQWEASYLFSKTGRKVHNKITAHFEFQDGLIAGHLDEFNFWKWSAMALGVPGYILGWSPFLQKKVQGEAMKNLRLFRSSQ